MWSGEVAIRTATSEDSTGGLGVVVQVEDLKVKVVLRPGLDDLPERMPPDLEGGGRCQGQADPRPAHEDAGAGQPG